MIEVRISKTCAFAMTGKNAGWQRYDDMRKSFADMAEAQQWLRDEYGKAKRVPCYVDKKGGGAQQVGYVIGFRPKWRSKGDPVVEQHWVEFRECNLLDLGA